MNELIAKAQGAASRMQTAAIEAFLPDAAIILLAIGLIVGGAITASELLGKKIPKFEGIVEKIAPARGVIGITLMVLGGWLLLWIIFSLGYFFRGLFSALPLSALVMLISTAIGVLLGFFLSKNIIAKQTELSQEKIEEWKNKISKYQTVLGIAAIGGGVYLILWRIISWGF
jgi:low affinity Fe/Cu permease